MRLGSTLLCGNVAASEAPLLSPFSPQMLLLLPRSPFNYNYTRRLEQNASGAESRIYGTLFDVPACDTAFASSHFVVTATDGWGVELQPKASRPAWRRVVANLLRRTLRSSTTAEEFAIMHNKVERDAGGNRRRRARTVVETALALGAPPRCGHAPPRYDNNTPPICPHWLT